MLYAGIIEMPSVYKAGFLVFVLLAVGVAYLPGLNGPFIFDDAPNLMENQKVHIEELSVDSIYNAIFSIRSGPLYRPISMLSVALNYYWGGAEVWNYKIVNLSIHTLSTLAVFYLVYNLLRAFALLQPGVCRLKLPQQQWWAALLAAALWGLHPLNLTSVLYVIQRMASLAGLFTFLAVALYLQGRIALHQCQRGVGWYWSAAGLMTILGILSKENALLIPLFIALVEACTGRWFASDRRWLYFFQSMRVVSYLGLLALGLLLAYFWNNLTGGYYSRPFSMEERLLTELRVLWHYLSWIFVPDIRAMGLFHDDIAVSRGLLSPLTTVLSMAGILFTLLIAWFLRVKQPLMALAIFWFFTAHLLESTIIPIELVHEHRNYVALLGPVLLVVLLFHQIAELFNFRTRVKAVCALAFGLALMSQTYARSSSWVSYQSLLEIELENHPKSTRVLYENGRLWYVYVTVTEKLEEKEKYYQNAKHFLERAYRNDDEDFAALPGLIRLQTLMGKPPNMEWFNELERRFKTSTVRGAKLKHLFELIECRINGSCEVPFAEVYKLIEAVLSNPHGVAKDYRSALVNAQGALKWTEGQYGEAAVFFRQAYTIKPKKVFAVSALNAYIENGNYSEARRFASESIGLSDGQLARILPE